MVILPLVVWVCVVALEVGEKAVPTAVCGTGYQGDKCDQCMIGWYKRQDRCLQCQTNCVSCTSQYICTACKVGFIGEKCDVKCPENCLSCYSTSTGNRCYECREGYTGDNCTRKCVSECKTCSILWDSVCTSCALGKHTNNKFNTYNNKTYLYCSYDCSKFCLHGVCDDSTGRCSHGCVNGYIGDKCLCPDKCTDSGCYESSQTCNSGNCESGYTGDRCSCTKEPCVDSSCSACSNITWYVWSGWSTELRRHDSFCCKCSSTCKDNICSDASTCLNGCIDGFYGDGCSKRCFERDTRCLTCTDTACNRCVSGYFPSRIGECTDCSHHCSNGNCCSFNGTCTTCKYGPFLRNFTKDCSDRCQKDGVSDVCDTNDGSCKLGCTSKTLYGNRCELNCNTSCSGQKCDWTTGKCSDGCVKNFFGEWCENRCSSNCIAFDGYLKSRCYSNNGTCIIGCHSGYFGEDCQKKCGANCVNDTCSRKAGDCILGCIGGFEGNNCAHAIKKSGLANISVVVGTLTVGVALLIGAVVVTVIFVRRRRTRQRKEKQSQNNGLKAHGNIANDNDSSQDEPLYHTYESIDGVESRPKDIMQVKTRSNVCNSTHHYNEPQGNYRGSILVLDYEEPQTNDSASVLDYEEPQGTDHASILVLDYEEPQTNNRDGILDYEDPQTKTYEGLQTERPDHPYGSIETEEPRANTYEDLQTERTDHLYGSIETKEPTVNT